MLRHFGGSRENGDPSLFSCDGRQGKPCSRLSAKRSTNWGGLVRCSLMRAQKFVKRAFLADNRCGGSGQLDRLLKLSARSLSTLPDYASCSNSSGSALGVTGLACNLEELTSICGYRCECSRRSALTSIDGVHSKRGEKWSKCRRFEAFPRRPAILYTLAFLPRIATSAA